MSDLMPYSSNAPAASPDLLDAVLDLARQAGKITTGFFRSRGLNIEVKGDGTPVTEGDKAAEQFIRERIAALDPGAAIIGEEEGSTPGTSGTTWIIDPIDGTKGFMRGVPLY